MYYYGCMTRVPVLRMTKRDKLKACPAEYRAASITSNIVEAVNALEGVVRNSPCNSLCLWPVGSILHTRGGCHDGVVCDVLLWYSVVCCAVCEFSYHMTFPSIKPPRINFRKNSMVLHACRTCNDDVPRGSRTHQAISFMATKQQHWSNGLFPANLTDKDGNEEVWIYSCTRRSITL